MSLDEAIEALQKIKRDKEERKETSLYPETSWSGGTGDIYMFDGYEFTGVNNIREDLDGDILIERI